MIEITGIRHAWPERAGFVIDRPAGHPHYTFLHFCSSVEILAGGLRQTAPPHACILYAPGTPQFFSSAGPLLHDWFHFTGDLPKGLFDCDTLHMADTGFFITELVREMEAEYAAGRLHSQLMLDIQVKELLIRLCRSEAGGPAPVLYSEAEEPLRRLRQQMLTHLSEPWPVERMAKEVHLSQSRFFDLYRLYYGKSPVDDLISAKIDAAKTALAFSTEPIAALAERLGYRHLCHFIRQFRQRTGTTPAAYRKGHQEKVEE